MRGNREHGRKKNKVLQLKKSNCANKILACTRFSGLASADLEQHTEKLNLENEYHIDVQKGSVIQYSESNCIV